MNKTRLFIVVALTLLVSTMSFAQKGSVNKADAYLNKSDFANAKAEIDVAITIEKNAAKIRTWYVRAQIYEEIAKSEDLSISSIDPEALDKAIEAYGKVFSMDKTNGSYYGLSTLNMDVFWGNFLNVGGIAYGEKNYEVAMANFEKALAVKPGDSTTLLYAGAAAQQMEKKEKTLFFYEQMVVNGYADENVFSTVIFYNRSDGKNEKALEMTLLAKEQFPTNKNFASEELSLLMILNKLDEAKMKLKAAIEKDPSELINHLNLAVLYDNEGSKLSDDGKASEARAKFDSAIISYNNTIKLEAENYVANYNVGAIYVNYAKEYLDEARDMDLKTYQKRGAALESKAKVLLKNAMPYFQVVIKIKPEDIDAHATLQTIYSTLKMYDEAEAMMNKVEELEAAEAAKAGE